MKLLLCKCSSTSLLCAVCMVDSGRSVHLNKCSPINAKSTESYAFILPWSQIQYHDYRGLSRNCYQFVFCNYPYPKSMGNRPNSTWRKMMGCTLIFFPPTNTQLCMDKLRRQIRKIPLLILQKLLLLCVVLYLPIFNTFIIYQFHSV